MQHISTAAIIYKLIRYSDKSAIAMAFAKNYGKLKLFVPNAYSRKGGIITFVPGIVNFTMKETSDLHKFGGFMHDSSYYDYISNPEIVMRLHLNYDFFEHLFHTGQLCPVFWNLTLKYSSADARKVSLYTIYRLLKEAGVDLSCQCQCGGNTGEFRLEHGELKCNKCSSSAEKDAYVVSENEIRLLSIVQDNESFLSTEFTKEDEVDLIRLYCTYYECFAGRKNSLKSVGVFLSMI